MKRNLLNIQRIALLTIVVLISSAFNYPEPASYEVKTVVIDAGHGGHDGGCSGRHSKEKHLTLKVAKQLRDYIKESFPYVKVILTRETDVFVKLHERSAIANRNNADLFISIHCNAASNKSSVYGTETYVMGLHKTESNLNVAKRENSVILSETDYSNHYDGFDPNSPMAHISFSLFQNAYQDQSIFFADLVEKQFSQRAGRKSRGVKQAGFLVLYKTAMPSVLIESGFLTNRKEEDFLKSTYGQEIIASAIYRAFKEYKNLVESKGNVAFINAVETMNENNITVGNKVLIEDNIPIENTASTSYKENSGTYNIVSSQDKIVYKVQIFASASLAKLNDPLFRQIAPIEIDDTGNIKRFLSGYFFDYGKVQQYCAQLKAKGFKDAFVVKYVDGNRVY